MSIFCAQSHWLSHNHPAGHFTQNISRSPCRRQFICDLHHLCRGFLKLYRLHHPHIAKKIHFTRAPSGSRPFHLNPPKMHVPRTKADVITVQMICPILQFVTDGTCWQLKNLKSNPHNASTQELLLVQGHNISMKLSINIKLGTRHDLMYRKQAMAR